MPQYIALLGGINVGGHNVKMADLKALFESLGFSSAATFIASGNVIFETPRTGTTALETEIEAHLKQALGYAVPTFLRTPAELATVAAHWPFPAAESPTEGASLYVTFYKEPIGTDMEQRLVALNSDTDLLAVSGRELYWLCRVRSSDSPLASGALVRKALGPSGSKGTARNMTTVRKLAAKYPAGEVGI